MFSSSCKKTVEGCMDKNSIYYNPDATIDDGSCIVKGCTNEYSENYNSEATEDDGSCIAWSEKFIGDYIVTSNCSLFTPLNTPFIMTINSIGENTVSLNFKTNGLGTLPTTGTINNDEIKLNELSINEINQNVETPIGTITIKGLVLNGEAVLGIDNNLSGTIFIVVNTSIGEQQDICSFVGIKQY